MINVLINAYAVSPSWGSEPGVGWNWIVNLAKSCNVFVITEGEWKDEIEVAVKDLPQCDNIHFYYNPVSPEIRKMCWNQGDWRFYIHYRKWQLKTLDIAKEIIADNRIDIIHQLNMIGFREPGYLWSIDNIPFVWGPIGNMAPLPIKLLEGSSWKDKLKQGIKNSVSYCQARTGRVRKAIKHADHLITVLDSAACLIKDVYGIDNVMIMPETGLTVTPKVEHRYNDNDPLKLIWVGRFIPTKKLDIAIEILSRLQTGNVELHIVGWGSQEEETKYRELASKLGVASKCIWYGKIPNQQVQELMRNSDIFLFTSVVEGTPHVVLESISNNLPVLCFDMCGQGVIVNDTVGWKIPIKSMDSSVVEMVKIIDYLEKNRHIIKEKSDNCELRKPELSWESKIERILELYKELANK